MYNCWDFINDNLTFNFNQMHNPNFISTGLNKISQEIMALGLDHNEFIVTSIDGSVSLLVNEKYEIDEFKLGMLHITLETMNDRKS